ncbi:MAG TPA: FMN-binding protein [Mycobacteriales bacterium]|nr:FMN-binding protein [Mycobacteriales bacterium]
MRRAALALVTTIVGLVLLLGYKTAPTGSGHRPAALAPQHPAPSGSPHPKRSAKPTGPHRTTPPAPAADRTVTGQTVQTPYGPVQVRVTLHGTSLTDVSAVQLPSDQQHSRAIASYAAPILRQEALTAGSAHIDIVSGATYTSDGYAQSLQSALDQVGIR